MLNSMLPPGVLAVCPLGSSDRTLGRSVNDHRPLYSTSRWLCLFYNQDNVTMDTFFKILAIIFLVLVLPTWAIILALLIVLILGLDR